MRPAAAAVRAGGGQPTARIAVVHGASSRASRSPVGKRSRALSSARVCAGRAHWHAHLQDAGVVAMARCRATSGRSARASAIDWLHSASPSHQRSSTAWQGWPIVGGAPGSRTAVAALALARRERLGCLAAGVAPWPRASTSSTSAIISTRTPHHQCVAESGAPMLSEAKSSARVAPARVNTTTARSGVEQ